MVPVWAGDWKNMTGDGLDDPLGTKKKVRIGSLPSLPRGTLVVVVGLVLTGLGFLAAHEDRGRGGEPFAVAAIDRSPAPPAAVGPLQPGPATGVASPVAASVPPSGPSSAPDGTAHPSAGQNVQIENGVKVVRPAGRAGSTSLVLTVPEVRTVGLAPAPDPRLTETSAFGPLPKVGADGSRPADVYGRRSDAAGDRPRIAILIGGMGLDRAETARAETSLPGGVTFGFAPYGPDLEAQVRQAREAGHEVVLQLPMEDFRAADPPLSHMLVAGTQGNEDRLHWLLARFTGYAGVSNYLGGRLLGDEAALRPLLQELAARGLYFLDDGSAARSLALPLAADVALPSMRADVIIDTKADPEFIAESLSRLELLARSRGFALGVATGLPRTNGLIGRYVADLEHRGISLVSVSQGLATEPRLSLGNGAEKPAKQP